ncbi:hypothetical protein Tco_0817335, partial [Tanacetum coccineum]
MFGGMFLSTYDVMWAYLLFPVLLRYFLIGEDEHKLECWKKKKGSTRRRKFLTGFQSSLLHQKRAQAEEIHKKQAQVKDWLHHIGIGDQITVVHDNDEHDDGAIPVYNEDSVRK